QDTNTPPTVHFKLLKGGLTELAHGDLDFTNALADLETPLAAPGTLLLETKWKSADGKEHRVVAGAVTSPERVELSAPRPDDFDEFWNAKLTELEAVPA